MKSLENEGSQMTHRSQSVELLNSSIMSVNKFPFLFSLFDQITQITTIPKFLSFLVALFFYMQITFSATWPYSSLYQESNTTNIKIIQKEVEIFWFIKSGITSSNVKISLIVNLVVFLACAAWFLFIAIFYHIKRKFIKWTLFPIRMIYEIICLLFLHPSAATAGFSFVILIEDYKNSVLWIQFIFCLIFYFCFLFAFIGGYSIMCSSSIINSHIYATFDPFYMIILATSSSLMVFFSFLFYTFQFWVINILQVIHFVIFLYVFLSLFHFHFQQIEGNIFAFAVLASSLVLDVLMFILNIYTKVTILIPIIASYSLFVITLIVGHFLLKALCKKYIRKLKSRGNSEETVNDTEFFKSLNIDSNSKEALKYFRLGLASRAESFTDWSLAKFIVAAYKDDINVLCSVLQIVTFFPMNKLLSDVLFNLISKKTKEKFWQKFTIYQSYKIKVLRQSSIPLESNERMIFLRLALSDCEYVINSLWSTKVKPSVGIFETILKMTSKTEGLWQEGIREYPNNLKLREDYVRFLIECKTDFKQAILQKHLINMIENGVNFSTDYAFKKFVMNYPSYLKKKVIDVHGNFIQNKEANDVSSTSSSSNRSKQTHVSSSDDVIDFEVETALAKSLISQSKLRMSLYNATKKSHLALSKAMIITAVISLIAALACFISTNVLLTNWIHKRSLDSSNSQMASDSFFNLNIAALDHIISFARETERYPFKSLFSLQDFAAVESGLMIYISFYGYIKEYATQFLVKAEKNFQEFLDELTNQAFNGLNIYRMASMVFNVSVPGISCRNKTRSEPFERSLKDAFSDLFYDFLRLNEVNSKDLYTTDAYCEIPKNLALISDPFMNLFKSLLYEQNSLYLQFKKDALIVQILMPILIFVLQFFPFLIVSLVFSSKMKKFASLLMKLNPQIKENCRKPIMLSSDENDDQFQSDHFYIGHRLTMIILVQALLAIVGIVLLFLMVSTAIDTNEDFNKINRWQYLSSKRFILSTEITHFAFLLIINNGSVPAFITRAEIIQMLGPKIQDIRKSSMDLLRGNEMIPTSVGYDSKLDEINFKELCDIGNANKTDPLHDLYRCASGSHAVNVFCDFSLTILLNANSYGGQIADPLLINFIHLANSHLFERLSSSNERLAAIIRLNYDKFCLIANIIMVIGIIIGIFLLLFQVYASFYSNRLYHVGLSLVRRIPPILFVSDKDLLNFVFNQHSKQLSHSTCPSQSVILNSKNGMVGVSVEGTIEIINKGLTETLGYSPEQLLGQPIDQLFKEGDGEKVNNKMTEIIHGESPLINEDHLVCITDSGDENQCQIFIIGLKGKNSKVDSFALLIKDETSLIEQRQSAEKAKAQSESLLFQILPRSIVSMINRGDRDISFTVPSASIIFTDIIKFSEYSASLSPAEVMGNLSTIFASFDEAIKKYPLITKIKLIGDIYMAAAGLFGNDSNQIQPVQHAEQTIKFGLDCLEAIETNNIKLNSSLQLRIGVNSGGPLIAGVLGSDKPVFDIIGDPINVAARLQTTDLPGKIQIPQSTYDLISNSGFVTEERGEVFLKGKGKTIAYFVSPMSATIASLTNEIQEE